MNRDRSYYRKMRAKHIRRKKRIAMAAFHQWSPQHDGEFAKGKLHCSCRLCQQKTNNKGKRKTKWNYSHGERSWNHSDQMKVTDQEQQELEYDCGDPCFEDTIDLVSALN